MYNLDEYSINFCGDAGNYTYIYVMWVTTFKKREKKTSGKIKDVDDHQKKKYKSFRDCRWNM